MNFVVIGAGAWGTAFALHLSKRGHTVSLAPRRFEQAVNLATTRENRDYLPGVKLPPSLQIGHELAPLLMEADAVLLACPSYSLRETCVRLGPALADAAARVRVVSLAKGLELGTHLRPSQVIAAVLPGVKRGALTGPTNAGEVARGLPAAMVLATEGEDADVVGLQAALSSATLRVYTSGDLAGVEFGGCLKNIYAIAAGCSDGLRLGDNTKAALLTRALAEMVRLGVALGAQPETFYGLSGFGDLVATCTGAWSRNRGFGEHLGQGRQAADLIAESKSVVEGYHTAQSFFELCRERGIEAPILTEVHRILYEGKPPAAALSALMTRGLKRE
ncbi:MAG: NAD(P)-dependent glycerol-3-phosphate dehydrogenase [Opitutaceae bacterium]|nr:NAD(P)-dependent glycerol-3-phosphate dehydrogenase [Opitutaceae bacterium]